MIDYPCKYEIWRREVAKQKRELAVKLKAALESWLPRDFSSRVWIFGSCAWPWKSPHYRSDIDIAIDDRGLSPNEAFELWRKVFAIAEEFFGEDFVDVCFFSELPGRLVDKIKKFGWRVGGDL